MHKHVESALKAASLYIFNLYTLEDGSLRSVNGSLIYLDFYVK